MSPKSFFLTPEIHEYVLAHASGGDDVERALIEETAALPNAGMQIAPEQGRFMTVLCRALGVRNAVEVGTFTGFSALAVARALPDDGRLVACDLSEEWTSIARRYWEQAGVAHKIDLRIGPAIDSLRALPADETLDFAFIDADKTGYGDYYEELLARLRPGGVLLVDNTLWNGAILDPEAVDEDTVALRAFNNRVADDVRVDCVLLTIADGLTMLRKR